MADEAPAERGWTNWAGTVSCRPRRMEAPASEDAVRDSVRRAAADGLALRVAGSGHSFAPLVATDGVLLLLDALAGVVAVDGPARRARIRAGTKLHALGDPLREAGLAMENLGDVDVQALAGALSTGTHGTGRTLGNLPSQVAGLRLVTAEGDVLPLSREDDPDLLAAARVSLGALGVITEVTLSLVPAYKLHERTVRMPMDEALASLEAGIAGHRHYEFWWYPGRDLAEAKTLDPTDAEPGPVPGRKYERVDWSARVLPSVRELRFHEMEYALPAEAGPAAFAAVRERMQARHGDVVWPVEYRTVAPDDAWLSPAHDRPTVTLSLHQDATLPFREFFADVEPLLQEHGGRPHWGKIHTCNADRLARVHPRFDDFRALRARLDPEGRFLNAHLRALFGL